MPSIKKRLILNERKEAVAVILDLETFEKMEDLVADHLFGEILQEAAKEPPIPLAEAKRRYARMKKPRIQRRR